MSGKLRLSDYPANWREVSRYVRFGRAQGRCECTGLGLCGLHCTHPGPHRCVERDREPAVWARGRVILTTAHICTCEPLCQKCHLRTDIRLHSLHSSETRRREKEQQGQIAFLFMS